MKAVTWQGVEDVRVEEVPDPGIEQPTDAVIRVTSTGLCGSDLHLYKVLGHVHRSGRRARPRADGDRRGGRGRGRPHLQGRPGRDPLQHLLRPLLDVRAPAVRAVRDHAEPRYGDRRLALRLHQALRPGARRPGRDTCASRRPSSGRSRSRRARRTTASSSSPTCCRRPGRRSSSPTSPKAGRWRSSVSDRSVRCRRGLPSTEVRG